MAQSWKRSWRLSKHTASSTSVPTSTVNKEVERLMNCKWPGGFFFPQIKSIACFRQHEGPFDRFCQSSHQEDKLNSRCDSWRLDEAFAATWQRCELCIKVSLRGEWESWMTSGEKSFPKTGCMWRTTLAQVCQWILTAWGSVKKKKKNSHQQVSKGWTAAWWRGQNKVKGKFASRRKWGWAWKRLGKYLYTSS